MYKYLFLLILFLEGCDLGGETVSSGTKSVEETKRSQRERPDLRSDRMDDPAVVGFMAGLGNLRPPSESLPSEEGEFLESKEAGDVFSEETSLIAEDQSVADEVEASPEESGGDLHLQFAAVEEMVRLEDPRAKEALSELLGAQDPKIQVEAILWYGAWIERDPEIRKKLESLQ